MSNILDIIKQFNKPCDCGVKHETTVKDIEIGHGLKDKVGEILVKNNFSKNILLVADENTLKASKGIEKSLKNFNVTYKIYDKTFRVATMQNVNEIQALIHGKDISILAIGTGSVHDTCRLACARENKLLCLFATAPSMDGFASYGAPIVDNNFKINYSAKSPEVIIGDTEILASAPIELKSAGFGDMVAKYVGLIDWQVSALLTGEYYCEKVANLTRDAVDELMLMADKVTKKDEETAGKIFEALLKTGLGMSFTQNSRPASGAEHIVAHVIELKELLEGKTPNFHGEDVGVATLETLKFYEKLANKKSIETQKEEVDWQDVYSFYGIMSEDVKKMNTPNTIVDGVNPNDIKSKWSEIVKIINSVPSAKDCENAMKKAGCKVTIKEIGKSEKFFNDCFNYSPYMRRRLTLLRLKNMIK